MKHTIEIGPGELAEIVIAALAWKGYKALGRPSIEATIVTDDGYGNENYPAFRRVTVEVEDGLRGRAAEPMAVTPEERDTILALRSGKARIVPMAHGH